jgi:hypothetical protein
MSRRRVLESNLRQGEDEAVAYSITTTPWGSDPSDPQVNVYDVNANYADVSDACLDGEAQVFGDVITTPRITNLTAGRTYRVDVQFTVDGNLLEAYFLLRAER